MAAVVLDSVQKRYGPVVAVHDVSLDIPDGAFVVLVGPSGCGKSTTLRMIAGLEDISGGTIRIGDRVVNALPPRDRDIAMVFQNYALYQHMTVYDNLAFGLRNRKVAEPEIAAQIDRAVAILGLGELMSRKPRQLSGGQQQRVALGRCIVRNPKVFLFDEPLSNLDAKLRAHMRYELKRLRERVPTTSIYVTHDQVEAMTLGDIVVVMHEGKVQQAGAPLEVYNQPANRFVATFIGSPAMNVIEARVIDGGGGLEVVQEGQAGGELRFRVPASIAHRLEGYVGQAVSVGIRPEHIALAASSPGPTDLTFDATVEVIEQLGVEMHLDVRIGGTMAVVSRVAPDAKIQPGERVKLSVGPERVLFFERETGVAIR